MGDANRIKTFTIPDGSAVSNSIRLTEEALARLAVPAMTASTALLALEETEDADSVADGSATWVPVYLTDFQAGGTAVQVGCGTSARAIMCPPWLGTPLGRVRLHAYQTGGTVEQTQTGAKAITAYVRAYR